jgi:hypothetical protein
MNYKIAILLLCSMAFSAYATPPVPGALPKVGSCPASYVEKGNECEPAKEALFAIPKSGECPLDYEADGSYCLAGADARLAIRRAAMTCPKGFTSVGDYCVSDK